MIGRHKFSSGVPDGANSALILPSDWNQDILIGRVLTNRTGGTLNAGDVVAISSANDESVVLADTAGARRQYVVFVSALPSSSAHTPGTSVLDTAQGLFLPAGAISVAVAGATTRGNYLRKSATSKALEDTSVAVGSAPPGDAIAIALSGTGGVGSVGAIFHGLPISPGGNLKSVQVFTGSGTWTRPAGIRRVWIEVVGGGGGGGGTNGDNTVGNGGGGGGHAAKFLDVSTIASSTITVGAAGAAGAAANGTGGAGGNSSWADGTNTVTGNGGGGGTGGGTTNAPGGGGTGTGGNVNAQGSQGEGGGTVGTTSIFGGRGGAAGAGKGAGAVSTNDNVAGLVGNAHGGGGSGGHRIVTTDRAGGAGAAGVVVVWEYE